MQQPKKATKVFLALAISLVTICSMGQEVIHPQSSTYEWPTEPDVKAKLEKWQDQKFGIILHWGLYAVPGIEQSEWKPGCFRFPVSIILTDHHACASRI